MTESREKLRDMITSITWKKTDYISPHEYFKRDQNSQAFDTLCELIDHYGHVEKFRGRDYQYLHFEAYKYWHFRYYGILNRAERMLKP